MGLFSRFRRMLGRGVELKGGFRDEFVHFYKLKGGELKVNSKLYVDEGYVAIVAHYDKICDVLVAGEHTFNEVDMPLLTRCNKPRRTRKGMVVPKKINADIYYINLNKLDGFKYKSGRVTAIYSDDKKKIKLLGSFALNVADARKLITFLLSDHAVIKNKAARDEVESYVGYNITKILEINTFPLEQYIAKSNEILELLNSYINKSMSRLGVHIGDIKIDSVVLSKKLEADLQQEKEKVKDVGIDEEALRNLINNELAPDKPENQEYVTVEKGGYSQAEQVSPQNVESPILPKQKAVDENINYEESYNKYVNEMSRSSEAPLVISDAEQLPPELLREERRVKEVETPTVMYLGQDGTTSVPEQIIETPTPKPQVETSQGTNKCGHCGTELQNGAKFCFNCGKSTSKFKTCPCCGAKNFSDVDVCILCKSKLD